MQGLKYVVTDFVISICEKSYSSSKPTGQGQTMFFEVVRPYLDFRSEFKKSVTIYFLLGCVEAVCQVSARLKKKSMKTLGTKAFRVIFRAFFVFLKKVLKNDQLRG